MIAWGHLSPNNHGLIFPCDEFAMASRFLSHRRISGNILPGLSPRTTCSLLEVAEMGWLGKFQGTNVVAKILLDLSAEHPCDDPGCILSILET